MVATLLDLASASDPTTQVAATWLLKAYVEGGRRLSHVEVARLAESLTTLPQGHAALHVCQLIGSLEIPGSVADAYATFAARCLDSSAPFVRAWATDALHRIASMHPRFADEAHAAVAAALIDPAPSVRARARIITEE